MATQHDTTDTRAKAPADALAVLYEAQDLLNVMRDAGEESDHPLSAPQWTLSTEISRRLGDAIACLDGAVPRPADRADGADTNSASKPVNVLRDVEDADSALDSTGGTLRMAISYLEVPDQPCDIRPLYVCASAIDEVRKALLILQQHMIAAKGRGESWDIRGAT